MSVEHEELKRIEAEPLELSVKFADLAGKSVFLTGGGSGIGAYFLQGFLLAGARVGYVDLPADHHAPLCALLATRYGSAPLFYPADVRDASALEAAMAQFTADCGPADVIVNNAARDTRHLLADWDADQFTESINLNLRPHYLTARYFAPAMAANGGGSIINMSSASYLLKMAGMPAYVAAKAAVTGLTGALARELGPDNIRVNALIPGWVMTERQKALWATPDALATAANGQALKQQIAPADMVAPCLFLASEASRMMSAQTLVVDGGWT